MALVFKTFYTVEFDTTPGPTPTKWQLDILRSYDDADPVPSWFSDPVVNLIGSSDPIEIEYQRDWDVYKPIQGSEAVVNLIVESAGQYIDLNAGTPFEWQVRLRYRDSGNTLQPFWCGYINPVDGNESVSTFPFEIGYTALDGLGLLEQRSVPPIEDTVSGIFNGRNDISIFSVVQYALRQTGLGLDVYVDSGIENSTGDALINTMIDPYSFYEDEDKTNLVTLKDALEGILSTYNCKVIQAKGRWYIYNASTLKDSTTWKVFNTEGVAQSDSTESLAYSIAGTTGSLIPANSDLVLNTRRPYGSIECSPQGFVAANLVTNGGFELQSEGWQKNPSSFDDLEFSDTIRLEGLRSIVSDRNRRTLTNASDVWFESSDGYDIEENSAIDINIDWLGEILVDSGSNGVRNVRLAYQVYFVPNAPLATSFLQFPSLGLPSYQSISNSTLFWDFVNTEWKPFGNTFQPGSKSETLFREPNVTDITKEVIAGAAEVGEWLNEKITIDAPKEYYDAEDAAYYEVPEGKIYLRFFYPRGNRQRGSGKAQFRQHGEGSLRAYVDNITIESNFDNDIESPTFERVQEDYTSTYTYEPRFATDSNSVIIQTIDEKSYSRFGVIEDKSLEELGTQFKLNDFRSQFKYYEGSLINNTSTPFSAINKIGVNFANYSETNNGIFNGGKFNAKKNTFEVAFYIPNQATDIAPVNRMSVDVDDYDGTTGELRPGYYTENVDLVSVPFAGGSEKVSYVLGFDIEAIDSSSAVIANGLVPSESYISLVGIPGDTISYKLQLVPAAGYIGNASSFTLIDTTADPRPEYATYQSGLVNVQGNLELPLTITFPEVSEYEILKATIGVTEFTPEDSPDVNPGVIVITNSGDDLKANTDGTNMFSYDVSGLPGSVVHFTHHIAPVNSNFQVFGGNFDVTGNGDTNLSNLDATGGPDNVSIDFAYRIPVSGDPTPVTVTGDADAAGIIGVNLQEVNVTFGTAPTNTRFHEASNTFTGVPGDTKDYSITIIPDSDYQITSVQAPTLPLGIVANGVPYESGENWEIPIQVTIPALTDPYAVVQTAITQRTIAVSEEPYSLTFNVNDLGISNAMIPAADAVHRITFNESDFGNSITPFVINVNPVSGSMFTSNTDVAVDVNESSVVIADGSTITLPEAQFTAPVQVVSGAIAITVSGTFPSMGGQYTLDVNIVGNNSEGGAVQAPATTATLTRLTPGISCLGGSGSFELVTNGRWLAEVDTNFFTDAVNSGDGSFTESFTLPSGTWNIGGSYSPYRGESGEQSITLSANPQPFETAGSGLVALYNTSLEGRLTYTVSIYSQNINGSRGPLLTTATIDQHQDYGPGEATVPAGYLDSTMVTISSATGYNQWTFNRPTS